MISFKANLISQEYIRKRNADNTFSSMPVSFVQLDGKSKSEVMAVRKLADRWSYGDEYAGNISDCMLEALYGGRENNDKFYAITKQTENLDKLNGEDILALALTSLSSTGENCIDYAQVEPKYVATLPEYLHGEKIPLYKKIGTALFDGIERMFKHKDLYLFTMEDNLKYYKRRGYKALTGGPVTKMVLKH